MRMQVPPYVRIAGQAGFALLALALVAALLFPPLAIAEPGSTDLWLEWRWAFFTDRRPGEQWDLHFLGVEIYALVTLGYALHLALRARARLRPVRATPSRLTERPGWRHWRRTLHRRHSRAS